MPLQVSVTSAPTTSDSGSPGWSPGPRHPAAFPDLDPTQIPMAMPVKDEKVLYLLDPIGASRRSGALRTADRPANLRPLLSEDRAIELPFTPSFLHKEGGLILSIGQLIQWMAGQVMAHRHGPGLARDPGRRGPHRGPGGAWRAPPRPGRGQGRPPRGVLPRRAWTCTRASPWWPTVRSARWGDSSTSCSECPRAHARNEWAVGMKFVVDLPEDTLLTPGTGDPHASAIPSPNLRLPLRPPRPGGLGRHLRPHLVRVPPARATAICSTTFNTPASGGTSRGPACAPGAPSLCSSPGAAASHSWPETALLASARAPARPTSYLLRGRRGLRHRNLAGRGRIEILEAGQALHPREPGEGLRRAAGDELGGAGDPAGREGPRRLPEGGGHGHSRHGPLRPVWREELPGRGAAPPGDEIGTLEDFYAGKIPAEEIALLRTQCAEKGVPLHDALMDRVGWPQVVLDGEMLVSIRMHCSWAARCRRRPGTPITWCSSTRQSVPDLPEAGVRGGLLGGGAASRRGRRPDFDREKCVHCGACLWSCPTRLPGSRSREPSIPRRRGRTPLCGELKMPGYQIVVLGGIVPNPLQTLEPVSTPQGPGLKNEAMLPTCSTPGPPMRSTRLPTSPRRKPARRSPSSHSAPRPSCNR